MDLHHYLGYFSGLHLIKPDMGAATLFPTLALVHILDAILCRLMAGQNNRSKNLWMIAGLLLGIWALLALFLLPSKNKMEKSR